jgi:hypothetical protein
MVHKIGYEYVKQGRIIMNTSKIFMFLYAMQKSPKNIDLLLYFPYRMHLVML